MSERSVPGGALQRVVEPLHCHCQAEGGNQKDEEGWKQVPVQRYRQPPSLPNSLPQVPLSNRIEALGLEGEVGEDVVESPPMRSRRQSTLCLKTASSKKE